MISRVRKPKGRIQGYLMISKRKDTGIYLS